MTKTFLRLVALLLALGLVAAACGNDDDSSAPTDEPPSQTEPAAEPEPTSEPEPISEPDPTSEPEPAVEPETEPDEPLRIAFFGFAAANGFAQATWAGVQEGAAEIGAEVEFFDPVFDANTQISQIQDAITAGDWDAFIIQANDGNAVVPVIEEALEAGIPVVGEFTPIGPDYSTIEPQVEGLIFVGAAPVDNGVILAEMAIEACEGVDPCNVVYLEGFRALPLDVARTDAFHSTIEAAAGVELIASVEGGYLPDTGLSAAQDVFVAHSVVHVMVGSAQAILGAEAGGQRCRGQRQAHWERKPAPGRGRCTRRPLACCVLGCRAGCGPHSLRFGGGSSDWRQSAKLVRYDHACPQREGNSRRDW